MFSEDRRLELKRIIGAVSLGALMFPIFFLEYIGSLNISEEAKTIIAISICFLGVAILAIDSFRVISKKDYDNPWFIVIANVFSIVSLVLFFWFSYKTFGESDLEVLHYNSQHILMTEILFIITLLIREILKGYICKRDNEIEEQQAKNRNS